MRTGILAKATPGTGRFLWGVVVGLWPIHWVLVIEGEPEDQFLEVTDWATEDYDTKRNAKIRIPCKWTVAKYPLDFRTPEQYMREGFVTRMRYEGYLPEADAGEDQLFEGAVAFARRRGKITLEGFFLKQFKTGTYAEYKGHRLWFEGKRLKEVRGHLEARYKTETRQDVTELEVRSELEHV